MTVAEVNPHVAAYDKSKSRNLSIVSSANDNKSRRRATIVGSQVYEKIRHSNQQSVSSQGSNDTVNSKGSPEAQAKATRWSEFKWHVREFFQLQHGAFYILYLLSQLAVFFYFWSFFRFDSDYSRMRSILTDGSFSVARGSAGVLNFDMALMLLTMCRRSLRILRRVRFIRRYLIPIDDMVKFHMLNAFMLTVATCMHVSCHIYNYVKLSKVFKMSTAQLLFSNGASITGIIILSLFFIMTVAAVAHRMYKIKHEIFMYSHQLYFPMYLTLMFHGAFCFTKHNDGQCHGSFSWYYNLAPLLILVTEKIMTELVSRIYPATVHKVVMHANNVMELQLVHPMWLHNDKWCYKSGEYLRLNIPEISKWQWHPFTITSCSQDNYVSVHIKACGGFTKKIAQHVKYAQSAGLKSRHDYGLDLGYARFMPKIFLDGPYAAPAVDFLDFQNSLLIGCGIGITPFASCLKSLHSRASQANEMGRLQKLYVIWVCKTAEEFDWMAELLDVVGRDEVLRHVVDIALYWTAAVDVKSKRKSIGDVLKQNDTLSDLRQNSYFGRPDWRVIFESLAAIHEQEELCVFFCGPKPLGTTLGKMCQEFRKSTSTKFLFRQEIF